MPMQCSRCGKCCEETEMLLSKTDIRLLEKIGFARESFAYCDKHGFVQLRNTNGHCVFYDAKQRCCKVYRNRPQGCRIYPIIFSDMEGVIVDDICPAKNTVTKKELVQKTKKLFKLLKTVDSEAEKRVTRR